MGISAGWEFGPIGKFGHSCMKSDLMKFAEYDRRLCAYLSKMKVNVMRNLRPYRFFAVVCGLKTNLFHWEFRPIGNFGRQGISATPERSSLEVCMLNK